MSEFDLFPRSKIKMVIEVIVKNKHSTLIQSTQNERMTIFYFFVSCISTFAYMKN